MSKGSRKNPRKNDPKPAATPAAAPSLGTPLPAGAGASVPAAAVESNDTSWLDSSDPRRRMLGKVVLAGVWVYVAALWLLALDQTFNWGIFGPKLPPL